jgi:hypothetical protein
LRIIVAGIDDNDAVRYSGEQIARQVWNVFLRNGYDYDVATLGGLIDEDGRGAGLRSEIGEAFRALELATNTL